MKTNNSMTFNLLIAGVSRGIGKAVAEAFLQAWETDRKQLYPGLEESGTENFETLRIICISGSGRRVPEFERQADTLVEVHHADFMAIKSLGESVREISGHYKEIHGIIINSGYLEKTEPERISAELLERVYQVNVFGPAILLSAFWPKLSKRGGHIVMLGSMGGVQGSVKFPGLSVYSSSKMALSGLGESLSAEAPAGWSVNTLALGSVRTEMLREAFPGYEGGIGAEAAAGYIKSFFWTGAGVINGVTIPVRRSNP